MDAQRRIRVGVLALQGGVAEHLSMLRSLGVDPITVRLPEQLIGLDGLILPGGESTAIGKLLVEYQLQDPLRARIEAGLPVYGTCAGMILLARHVEGGAPSGLGVMDIYVRRNAFGAQTESFEQQITVTGLEGAPLRAVFIRAPRIEQVGEGVTVLARLHDGTAVAAQQGHMLVSAFHPELGSDTRLHALFVRLCSEAQYSLLPGG